MVRTNDLVLLGAIEALLTAADIGHMVADAHMSVLEGSIGVFPPPPADCGRGCAARPPPFAGSGIRRGPARWRLRRTCCPQTACSAAG
ncbi:DUF2007 domain-containing protein [Xanthobacter flavus]|uniref:putative signal transducing protein n=1 Tax=Xanthobacter flavus TaxID=281 RepID=UPI003D7C24BC